ncbi:cartilage acidic protein 1-like [Liolophura sinensis]|uniref:cartilage acidic protein 1-like n=1 Tax=Liolophura sinensis TaxID=3198878 RepID=UPI003158D52F
MFKRLNWLDDIDTLQRNYGVAVSDVDADGTGDFEWIVAGFAGANFVLKFNTSSGKLDNIAKVGTPYTELRDVEGKAIGVCACDIDGDGREEIYFLNTNRAYAGRSSYGDKLFKWRDRKYVDLFSDPLNSEIDAKDFAGRSVACIDRLGTGKYSIIIATYSQGGTGKFALIEMDVAHPENNAEDGYIILKNVAMDAGIEKATGGRGIVVGPILSTDGRSDIFFNNEGNPRLKNPGSNFLFKNLGNGSFIDVANQVGLRDEEENGRGVYLSDFNKDGRIDVVHGNWEGKHRVFLQKEENGKIKFENVATSEFETPSLIRTVISADFDNDGHLEIFMNNIYAQNNPQPNRLFRVTSHGPEGLPDIEQMAIGDAVETDGCGTGAAVADIDRDGNLDLLVSHGEDRAQPLQIYGVVNTNSNHWIRVLPRTKFTAPARGAKVSVTNSVAETQTVIIDCGSGYLCQMEPVAHFGLSDTSAVHLTVQWPDGRSVRQKLSEADCNRLHVIDHPDYVISSTLNSSPTGKNDSSNKNKTAFHEEL